MTEEYKHVEGFPFWKGHLDKVMNNDDNTYNAFCTTIIREDTIDYEAYRKICSSFAKSIGYVYSEELNTRNLHTPSNMNMCQNRINNMNDTVFKDVQFLHNLFFNLEEFEKNYSKIHLDKCTYAKKCFTSYNTRINECIPEHSSQFCEKLAAFRKKYEKNMSITTYIGAPKKLQPFDEKSTADERSDRREDGTFTLVAGDLQGEGTPGSDFTNSLSSGFTLPVTIIIGIVSILVLFFKFTPLGTYARSLLQRKKGKFKNAQEEYDYYTFLNTDNSKKNSSNTEYNLAYHSEINS
ncbi:PIR protein [Plasmodium vivax]|uniref:VIR protein n=1 Tax=Plasmodium vivax TaxID=5855 RepID=A0A565A682_PLAVI|nr:PIR protein [Plasmodium vivax]